MKSFVVYTIDTKHNLKKVARIKRNQIDNTEYACFTFKEGTGTVLDQAQKELALSGLIAKKLSKESYNSSKVLIKEI